MLEEGKKAPNFELKDQNGDTVSLKDFEGQKVVLYFYPKDDTTGCTKEACSFRDEFPKFEKLDAQVIGVSPDSIESHKKFAKKYNLPFTLLSDEGKETVEAYDVWKQKSMYGRNYMGVERTTYIIDEKGNIQKVFPKVKVENHIEEVLKILND
jgi:thioredoxin-dependent peroxiredoxin